MKFSDAPRRGSVPYFKHMQDYTSQRLFWGMSPCMCEQKHRKCSLERERKRLLKNPPLTDSMDQDLCRI
jgi:hypothetical protein